MIVLLRLPCAGGATDSGFPPALTGTVTDQVPGRAARIPESPGFPESRLGCPYQPVHIGPSPKSHKR